MLSEELRNELAAIEPSRRCDRLAELSGLAHSAGRMHLLGRSRVSVHLDLAGPSVARRAFSLLRRFGVEAEIRTYRRRAFGRETRYQVHIPGEARAVEVLRAAGILGDRLVPLERPPRRVVGRSCCRAAYLRGALLGAGSLSGPRDPHLEIRTSGREGANFLARLTPLAVHERSGHALAYAKGAETIADVLAMAGASDTVLALDEHAVIAATRGRANRLANADHANLVRASRAAHEQLEAIRRLQRSGALRALPTSLQEIAALRLDNPSVSLRELALKCDPPATKAAAHRRLRKLVEMAERQQRKGTSTSAAKPRRAAKASLATPT
jgi:DNA-binding protein WhiA